MKRTLLLAVFGATLLLLSGCSTLDGLSINYNLAITYKSDVPVGTRKGQ